MNKPYLFFDAGGTLAFPDFPYITRIASSAGLELSPEQLFQAHCAMILDLDQRAQSSGHLADPFPNGYVRTLLNPLVSQPAILDTIVPLILERDRTQSLWTTTHPWVSATLDSLKAAGYGMSVISNSDGRVGEILSSLGLRPYFDQVFDSHALGVSKPSRRIFQIALQTLDIQPEEALYIGDVYYIDVWGANQAGLGCIHLDPQEYYQGWPGVHLPTVAHLPAMLAHYRHRPDNFNLHPTRQITISFDPE
jgi:HAD superfamily hydrolase (TIGR01549 family)